MDLAVIFIFFICIIAMDLIRGFQKRATRENVFFIISIIIGFTAMMLKTFDVLN